MNDFELPVVVLRNAGHVRMIDLDQADLGNPANVVQQRDQRLGVGLHALRAIAEEIFAECGDAGQTGGHVGLHVGENGLRRQMNHRHAGDRAERAAQPAAAADLHHAHGAGPANRRNRDGRIPAARHYLGQGFVLHQAAERGGRILVGVAGDDVVDAQFLASGRIARNLPGARPAQDDLRRYVRG